MKVVEVIPIAKGLNRPTLSYFTKESFQAGSFVKIPLRKGFTLGIVVSTMDARRVKSELKDASFALKKLSIVEKAGSLGEAFMQAVKETANFYATTEGLVLKTLLPKIILENPELLSSAVKIKNKEVREVRVIGLSEDERFREYRGVVRESLARGRSTLFIAPTQEEALKAFQALSGGIEKYVFTTAGKTPKNLKKLLIEAREEKHSILLITTPSLMVFDRKDLDTYILERENSRTYRSMTRPFIHTKVFLEYYVKAKGSTLILGDSVLSLESLRNEREGRYSEFTPITWRLKCNSIAEVIDLRAKKEFEVFSPRTTEVIREALSEGKNIFIFAARKGLSSTTVCGDCASLLLCKNCKAPLVLHSNKQGEGGVYACHRCGAKRSADTRCDHCQSWKLVPLGVGVDRVVAECRKVFEDTETLVVDKDHTQTKARVSAIIKRFESNRKVILVGTELALAQLKSVPVVIAGSMDSLFSIPDFGVNERIFYLINRMREIATDRFLLQTRNAGKEILEFAAAGNVLDFYRTEIQEREELSYPPFSLFIKVSVRDTEENNKKKVIYLQSLFADHGPHFIKEKREGSGLQTVSMILRIPKDNWPSQEIREKLLLLTPDFMVKVDPETIL